VDPIDRCSGGKLLLSLRQVKHVWPPAGRRSEKFAGAGNQDSFIGLFRRESVFSLEVALLEFVFSGNTLCFSEARGT
jgi:hypothetical protein